VFHNRVHYDITIILVCDHVFALNNVSGVISRNLKFGEYVQMFGRVNMREAQIYIKNIKKQKNTLSWGGGGRFSTGSFFYPPPPP